MTWTITFDLAKRERARRERGLDFADAALVFEGETFTFDDKARHVVSMRKANEREIKAYQKQFAED